MLTVFHSALGQMIIMFAFILLGYGLRGKGLLQKDVSKGLSTLEVWVFGPCLSLLTYSRYCTVEMFVESAPLLLTALATLFLVSIPLSRILSARLGRDEAEKAVYCYSLCFSNSGYMGYPIIQAVFGDEALMQMMIFCLPINLALSTYGLYILIPKKNFSIKSMINPTTIVPFVGLFIGIADLKLPALAEQILDMGSACMAPVAMILTGLVLANQPLRVMFTNWRAYLASLLRLVIIPLFVAAVMYVLGVRGEYLLLSAATLAMPMGLNSVVFPEAYGGDATYGSQANFVSNLLGLITIPIMLALFQTMAF